MNTHTYRHQLRSISLPAARILAAVVLGAAVSDVALHPELTQPIVDQARNAVASTQAYFQEKAAEAGHTFDAGDPAAYPAGYDQFTPFDSYFGRSARV